jgi:hypothetical protein
MFMEFIAYVLFPIVTVGLGIPISLLLHKIAEELMLK